MTKRTLKRVLLPLVLFAAVAIAATANAAQGPPKPRDSEAIWADIKSGRAPEVPTPPGRQVSWAGVWNGCKFNFLKSHISTYRVDEGIVEVSERPDPLPPKGPECVDREPTVDEVNAMRDHVTNLNAPGRPEGAPPPPTFPPATPRVPR